jgi:hypothetical protein
LRVTAAGGAQEVALTVGQLRDPSGRLYPPTPRCRTPCALLVPPGRLALSVGGTTRELDVGERGLDVHRRSGRAGHFLRNLGIALGVIGGAVFVGDGLAAIWEEALLDDKSHDAAFRTVGLTSFAVILAGVGTLITGVALGTSPSLVAKPPPE